MIGAAPLLLWLAMAPPAVSPLLDERVVVVGGDPQRSALVEAALRARGLRLLDAAERLGLDGPDTRAAAGDREVVRTRLLGARAAWRQLDLDAANRAVDEALAEALRLERPEDHLDLVVDALLLQATLALSSDDADAARRPLQLASRLEPERERLDPALHPPSLVAAWAEARAPQAPSVVVVRPRVVGGGDAAVIVDGRAVGVSGGLLEVVPGPHLITVRAAGCRGRSRVVDVGGDDVAIEDVLIPDDGVAARVAATGAVAAGDVAALERLLTLTDVDVIVGLGVGRVGGGAGGRVVAQRRGAPAVDVDVDPGAPPAAIADAVLVTLAPTVLTPPTAPSTPEADPMTGFLIASVIGGVTLAVGGGAAIAWFLWPGEAPSPPPRPVVVTCCTQ